MRFIYFTDIHLDEGVDSRQSFERCLESMLAHEPQLLINGGDVGVTPEAIDAYEAFCRQINVPVYLSLGNHEMCSGFVSRERIHGKHVSFDHGDVHFVILDVCRYNEPSDEHPHKWWVVADDHMLDWLDRDLAPLSDDVPLVVASHVPMSTMFPARIGLPLDTTQPTNNIFREAEILSRLARFKYVVTLHGHDHENSRHLHDHIHVLTTAAVAGRWWADGLNSPAHGGEPQGYRVIDIDGDGSIKQRYVAIVPAQQRVADLFIHEDSGRRFVNVIDGAPDTRVTVDGLGELALIDPRADSSHWLPTHLWELPASFDRSPIRARIRENGEPSTEVEFTGG